MSKKDEGGPAFPMPGGSGDFTVQVSHLGMTLRDYFAAKFAAEMVGSIDSDEGYLRLKVLAESHAMTVSEWIAEKSYHQADEMLKVRAK